MKTELVVRFEFQRSLPPNSEAKIKEFVKELQEKVKDIKVSEQLKGNFLNMEMKTNHARMLCFKGARLTPNNC